MHSFLRSIGFSKYKNRKQLEPLYKNILGEPNRKIITTVSVDTSMLQFERDYAEKMGVALVGEVDSTGTCSIEHHFPYLKGDYTLEFGNIAIEKNQNGSTIQTVIYSRSGSRGFPPKGRSCSEPVEHMRKRGGQMPESPSVTALCRTQIQAIRRP